MTSLENKIETFGVAAFNYYDYFINGFATKGYNEGLLRKALENAKQDIVSFVNDNYVRVYKEE